MRLWYQSFIDPAVHGPYFHRLREHLQEIGPDATWEVNGISPPDRGLSRLAEFRCAAQCVANAIEAERSGCDAFILGHFQDAGLWEARSAVDIPVIGMGEATMLYARQVGRTLGLVTIDHVYRSWHEDQAVRYGLDDRLVGVTTLETDVDQLVAAMDSEETYERLRANFVEHAWQLVERGAEVIVSAGGLFGLLSSRERGFKVGEAVVLNPVSVAVTTAQMALRMRELDGVVASRAGAFAKAPAQAVDDLRGLVDGTLGS
jgi:Asp/Glu/hydantoin racemase